MTDPDKENIIDEALGNIFSDNVDKYKLLLDAIDEGYCIIQMIYDNSGKAVNWRYLEVNRAFSLNNGLTNALGKTILETTPNIEPKWMEIYDSVAQTGKPLRFREESKAFNRVFNLYAFRVGNPDERTIAVIFTDITQQVNAQELLKISEEKQVLLLKLSDALREVANPVEIQYIASKLLGEHLDADQVIYAETEGEDLTVSKGWNKAFIPVNQKFKLQEFGQKFSDTCASGEIRVCHDIKNDDTTSGKESKATSGMGFQAYIAVPLIKNGNLTATFAVLNVEPRIWKKHEIETIKEVAERTCTYVERAKAENDLRVSEERFKQELKQQVMEQTFELKESRDLLQGTLDSSLEMIQVFKAVRNEHGKIIDFNWILNNDVSEKIYGDVIDKSLLEHNPGVIKAGIFEHFIEVTESGIPQQYEKHYVNEQFNGWYHQSVVKLGDGVATSTKDITQQKLAEKEIMELNSILLSKNRTLESLNSELTTFTDIAANDYNETFRSLYLNIENLIKSDAARLSNTGKANLRKAQSAIQKMKMLTEDIVAFSRLSMVDTLVEEVDLNKTLNYAIQDLQEKANFSNMFIDSDSLPMVKGYPMLLSLLFYHLLDNALKFARDNVSPVIKIKYELVHKDLIEGLSSTPFHKITFTDNGIGFPASEAENIFKIFYRLHERGSYKGSGIGLAVCRKIITLHGGYISAKSELNISTTITCLLPA